MEEWGDWNDVHLTTPPNVDAKDTPCRKFHHDVQQKAYRPQAFPMTLERVALKDSEMVSADTTGAVEQRP